MAFTYEEVKKFNPHHDPKNGRFTSGSGGSSGGGKYTQEERVAAIKDWADGSFGSIRKAQTGTLRASGEEIKRRREQAEALEEFIADEPAYKGYLCRGISTESEIDFKVGDKIDMNGISSWSKSEDVADEFAREHEHSYFFATENLSRAADISKHAMNPGEAEVLVSSKTKFQIKNVEYDPDLSQTIISLVEVEE